MRPIMTAMTVLIIGSGGREHALCFKLSESQKVKKIFCIPGNAGTSSIAENVDINIENFEEIHDFVKQKKIDLVINTTEGKVSAGDSYVMRRNTLLSNTPYYTTIKGAKAAVNAIEAKKNLNLSVRSLQSIH